MRLEHLTTDEILRMHEPQTELEKVLFARIDEAIADKHAAEKEAVELTIELDNWHCDDCDSKELDIEELQKVEKSLRALLDRNNLDHSEI